MNDSKALNRWRWLPVFALLFAGGAVPGCGGTGLDGDNVETETSEVSITGPSYQALLYQTITDSGGTTRTGWWIKCPDNQVVVGFHGSQQKVLCGTMPPGTTRLTTHIDLQGAGIATQITADFGGTTVMHGCPGGSYIQGILTNGSELLLCTTFVNAQGQLVQYNSARRQDNGSQSTTVYSMSNPQSHVCPATKILNANGVWTGGWDAEAMIGIHQGKNQFICVK